MLENDLIFFPLVNTIGKSCYEEDTEKSLTAFKRAKKATGDARNEGKTLFDA